MEKIGVFGLGTVGAGIVQIFAENGYDVIAIDRSEETLDKGILRILKNLTRNVQEGRMTEEERENIINKINVSINIKNMSDCDLVIETATENIEIKKKIFAEMDKICKPETILATNTSAFFISVIAEATNRPDKVIGMHFLNPVPEMNQIQIIKGHATSEETKFVIEQLAKEIEKLPEEDISGFLA